ncbi:restriction endonuclease subunit S [Marinobacter nauticus]|uniref:restriction endonuclease subunit S n=1 Tax=Marinobacter nauticus TaxID=2743 RepID=UPI001C95A798|nr:restriction endonuclease subunit S [Marinobacter nauticus]MBY6104064.1 restriction endonuclease subunit S [Marinobacter nauticus]
MSADQFPSHWQLLPLSEAVDALIDYRGKTPRKTNHGVPLVTAKIVKGGTILPATEYIAEEDYDSWMVRGLPKAGDVVVTTEAPLGEVAQLADENVALAQRIVTLRGTEGLLQNDYLRYVMQGAYIQGQLESRATGSTVKGIKQSELRKIKLPIPPEHEQIKIAGHLRALDDRIQLNHQINQTLEQMAQAIFKSWFVDFEPVKAKNAALEAGGSEEDALLAAMQAISGKAEAELARLQAEQPEQYAELRATAELFPSAMQDSELGEIPEGWRALPLYDTAEYVNGAAFKAKDFSESGSGLPIIKIAELKQGISEGTKYTNSEVKEKYRITDGSVLYSWSGSPETSLEVFKWFGGEGWLNQHIFKLNFTKGQSEHFTYFLLKQMKPLLVRTAQQKQTTGLGHITVADMKRIKIPYPSPELLSAFSENIEPLYSRSSNAVRESKTLADLRDTLLPKLLSGELSATGAEPHSLEAVEIANV